MSEQNDDFAARVDSAIWRTRGLGFFMVYAVAHVLLGTMPGTRVVFAVFAISLIASLWKEFGPKPNDETLTSPTTDS